MVDIDEKTGIWKSKEMESKHKHDPQLSEAIVKFLKKEKVKNAVDFGCGLGKYVLEINKNNIECDGYDGNPFTPELTNGNCGVIDLSKDFDLNEKFDCVISLEVGEHLPAEFEEIYMRNITKHTKNLLILSWATPHQGGDGHVNEKSNNYIRNKIVNLGFSCDFAEEKKLRESSSLSWFKRTIFVFRKN